MHGENKCTKVLTVENLGSISLSNAPSRWPEGNRAIIDEKKADLKTLDFDPVGLDDDDLLNLALEMFLDVGVHVRLGIEVFFFC
jgi:hypothetical protein